MKQQIQDRLRLIERECEVNVFYACEAGSRAWGIESPDSDYDVRFIFTRPPSAYLGMREMRDVIERPGPVFDISGWDAKKAFKLAAKSNPSLLEWLHSPTVYAERLPVHDLRKIMADFSPRSLIHHYISLAARQHKAYWSPNWPVRLKKYLYAVRPLMAVEWMKRHDYAMPPVRFADLRTGYTLSPDEEYELASLLVKKQESGEKIGKGRYPALDKFIEIGIGELSRRAADEAPAREPDFGKLDELFRYITTGR